MCYPDLNTSHPTILEAHRAYILGSIALRESNIADAVKYYSEADTLFQSLLKNVPPIENYSLWEAERILVEQVLLQLQPHYQDRPVPGLQQSNDLDSPDLGTISYIRHVYPKVTDWGMIRGLDVAKQTLDRIISIQRKFDSLIQDEIETSDLPSSVLMFGPPGCGKTLLTERLAKKAGLPLYNISPAKVLSRWVGESEKNVERIFRHAEKEQDGAILFFDEFDSLAATSATDESEVMTRVRNTLLSSLEGICKRSSKIIVIAVTNHPNKLSGAMRRRFEKRLYISPPDEDTIWQLLSQTVSKYNSRIRLTKSEWEAEVQSLLGYTAKEVVILARDSVLALETSIKHEIELRDQLAQLKEDYTPHFCTFDALEPSVYLFYDHQFGYPKAQIGSYSWEKRILKKKHALIQTHPKPNIIFKHLANTRSL